MRIGELAKRAGLSRQAIRYYERIGLLKKPGRTDSGYRDYREDTASFLRFVKKAQGLGFTLKEIETIREIRASGDKPCKWVSDEVARKIVELDEKIAELQELRRMLEQIRQSRQHLEFGDDESCTVCPLIEKTEPQQDMKE